MGDDNFADLFATGPRGEMPGILGECGGFKDYPALIAFLRDGDSRKICLAQEYGDNQTNRNHIPKGLMNVADSTVMFQKFPRPTS